MLIHRVLMFSFLTAVSLSLACSASEDDPQKPAIRLHDALSESQWINNAIAKFIIEEGYGYPVETVVESTPAMQEGLSAGTIDLNLEGWQQNIIDWYNAEIENGSIVNLGMIY